MPEPLLTFEVHEALRAAATTGASSLECSLDLNRSTTCIEPKVTEWIWQGRHFPYLTRCRQRTVYHWTGVAFEPVARYGVSLLKLVPTSWGPPTFEIDGIKMLPTARVSPFEDAKRKVALIEPAGRTILDTCGGLGYFAACCLDANAAQVCSYEKSEDVLWLRSLNPWSPGADARLSLVRGDIVAHVGKLPDRSFDAILHDPPRFGIAGELYSQVFYGHLARVLRPRGRLFHYAGAPNRLTSGRDVAREVAARLSRSGFVAQRQGDGILATKR